MATKEPPKRSLLPGLKVFWYLILIFGVIVTFSLIEFYSATQEITWNDFELKMLNRGAVEKMVV